jgi:hypothetical protein
MAFLMTMTIPGVTTIEAQMEMYMWPYANAKNQLLVMGVKGQVTKDLVDAVLEAADEKIVQAEKDF